MFTCTISSQNILMYNDFIIKQTSCFPNTHNTYPLLESEEARDLDKRSSSSSHHLNERPKFI